jgi:cytochrome c-type biogenesis protein
MAELLVGAVSALWLGILTSISPCPLATNIAAISYIGRRVGNARLVLLTGLLYALGRTLVYLVLGILLVASLLAQTSVSEFLERSMAKLLGPILMLVAMLLLGLVRFSFRGAGLSEQMQNRVDAMGAWGALLLGILFALSFCPASAGLFFMGLIPLSVKIQSSVILPCVFGVGTALPAVAFAILIAVSAQSVGAAFNRLSQIEWWARQITGILFLAIGLHYTLKYIFEITPFWDPWVQSVLNLIWGARAS